MNEVELMDQAIFSVLSQTPGHWRKVAFVISRVASAMGDGSADGDEGHEAVAGRIERLVSEGRLLAQGDIKNWRFSEVRLPN
jgi:hypothetical protein